jgi:RNA polymerase subunit RPABC4/transcription elongation factor Spt4
MTQQICSVCRSLIPEASLACPSCGIRRSNIVTSAATYHAVVQQAYPQPAPTAHAILAPKFVTGAEACPKCFGYSYGARFTWAHLLVAVVLFPVGLLMFLAPIKRCQCGAEYGVGRFIVSLCVWIAVFVAVCLLLGFAVFYRTWAKGG